MDDASDEGKPRPLVGRALLTLACVLGVGIGPAVAAGAAAPGRVPPVAVAVLMIALTAFGVAGITISVVRWTRRDRRRGAEGGPDAARAAGFGTLGQRASFALAGTELVTLAVAAPAVLVLHLTGPQEGPGKDVGAILVAALALVIISALIVPTIAAQVAWTWRAAAPDAEAAVLAGRTPGRRRMILVARSIAVIAWAVSTAGAGATSVLLVGQATQRVQAIAGAYSSADAADAVRSELLEDYVVGDIRCPDSLPDPARDTTFACRVTSLDRTATVRARWFASGFGNGGVNVIDPTRVRLVRIADLPDDVPTAVPLDREATEAEVVSSVRSQLIAESWSPSSRAVLDLRCPSIGSGYTGFVRCTIGRDAATQRYLDVYPVGRGRFVARTAEIADLPR